jgi:hypothetical protein
MQIPSHKEAESFLGEAQTLNPGPWFSHSLFVAKAAEIIADHHSILTLK